MTIEVKTKRWGNSLGIVIPMEIINRMQIKPEESIIIDVQKKENVLRELFGKAKTKKTAKEAIESFRRDTESKWLK